MSGPFIFDAEKATEALLYTAARTGGDMYVTLKVLYLADKCHLHKYGRFITGDQYYALPHGPVPDGAYALVKQARRNESDRQFDMDGNRIVATRNPDCDVFSDSDLECLNAAIEQYGNLSFNAIKLLTHDAAYNATTANAAMSVTAIAGMAEDPVTLLQHLSESHPG